MGKNFKVKDLGRQKRLFAIELDGSLPGTVHIKQTSSLKIINNTEIITSIIVETTVDIILNYK